uniref:Uncharacterized protein n=1 Tax=Vespula pensylvanica TaxID=30213 RepID=A0A834U9Y3_VESPE|nr:hypothetical protein H0235_007822 [Vespula pensylvanica]
MSLFSSTNFRSNRIITEFRGNNLLFELVRPTDSLPFVLLVADPMGKLYGSSINSINSTSKQERGKCCDFGTRNELRIGYDVESFVGRGGLHFGSPGTLSVHRRFSRHWIPINSRTFDRIHKFDVERQAVCAGPIVLLDSRRPLHYEVER